MYSLLILLSALFGAATGALVPRARYRLSVEPEEAWRSSGPCGHAVAGWAGPARCRVCGGRYGPGALWPALVAALVCAVSAAAVGARPELAVWLAAAPVAVLLAGVDWSVRRLPDVLTLPLAAGMAALLGVAALIPGAAGVWPRSLLGGLALGGGYLALHLLHSAGLGFGDVKLAAALGCALGWYGWWPLLLGTLAGLLLGSAYSWWLLAREGRGAVMPLGPFMIAGAWLGILLGAWTAG
ncbi:leader peptidase (prepilin peptidase)/N-methyltransferase [Streptomyces olivoverticillatus]|uniref:Leader peptidase (Prepilin peptidase)/N-methyltransferase n=1 Tax=Streptomyces olivoverticillatus TaxID=66427 RepID=A0A7W7LKM6_9ACTN|nr:A24 family peptidase [Streptomyces olivoverticillatus]MBB4891562.1 leader peptidase (prepilin peptidase)/N-methyltransferase [Streptomyces olivoverticillatus]